MREEVKIAVEALSAAHHPGIVHHVKSENITNGPDGYAKVLDFGLANLRKKVGSWVAGSSGDEGNTANDQ